MRAYHQLLETILAHGVRKDDRTGTGTLSVFGHQMRFDLSRGFPLLTTKRLSFHSIAHELLWFISGSTNNNDLRKHGVTIWDEWSDPASGDLGPIYGKQWRSWDAPDGSRYDQLMGVVERMATNPDCRRLIVSAWNPADIPDMALAPCHCLFQFYTKPLSEEERIRAAGIAIQECLSHERLDELGAPRRSLSCRLDQRSSDVFLGVPFNIASYALLTHMVARHHGLAVGDFIWQSGDTHLYVNHLDQVRTQLAREPRKLPTLRFSADAPKDLFEIRYKHLMLEGYDPHPAIKAPVAV